MSSPTLACMADRDATVEAAAHKSGRHRTIVLALALGALAFAWANMAFISRTDPWYRNTDMNIHNMVDALAINSDFAPNPFPQPGVPLKYLLALDFRIRHELGILSAWNMQQFGNSPDPLGEIRHLVGIERVHSRVLVMGLILAAAWLVRTLTQQTDAACLAIILLCGSSGLLFQGLLSRPELLCVAFGNVLALLCTWRGTLSPTNLGRSGWLFLAGLLGGLAMLEKLPGICYVGVCYTWCWLAAWLGSAQARPEKTAGYWHGAIPATAAAAVLLLLSVMEQFHDDLGPVVLLRLRVAATIIGLLPLVALWPGASRGGVFLRERARELALLGGGALAAFPLSYALLRGVMSEPQASRYMTGVLHFLVNPAPYMKNFLVTDPDMVREFKLFVQEAPVLFLGALLLSIVLAFARAAPMRLKAFTGLLLVTAMGLALLMSRRHFYAQYSIFPQVPLALIWALSIFGLSLGRRAGESADGPHWTAPLFITAAFLLMLPAWFTTKSVYHSFQYDYTLPVNPLTVTFLYDHDAHIPAYRQIMQEHYGSREKFATNLQKYLADPANRR